jgi:hypothetical protein
MIKQLHHARNSGYKGFTKNLSLKQRQFVKAKGLISPGGHLALHQREAFAMKMSIMTHRIR